MSLYRTAVSTVIAGATAVGLALAPATPASAFDLPYHWHAYGHARTVMSQLAPLGWPGQATHNFYPGKNGHPDIDSTLVWGTAGQPTTYAAKAQCAPLITLALKHAYGSTWATDDFFETNFGSESPTSAEYYTGVSTGTVPHFAKRTKLTELEMGDLIFIKYLSSNSANGDPTGHTAFFISRTPVDKDGDPNTLEWAVKVLDSTSNPHGVASVNQGSPYLNHPDTRAVGTTEYDGLGEGTMVLRTDAQGNVLGHWWGINENTVNWWYPVSSRPMVFAHLTAG